MISRQTSNPYFSIISVTTKDSRFRGNLLTTWLLVLLLTGCATFPERPPLPTDPVHQYFLEIALGSEFGNHRNRIKKWQNKIRIQVHGEPTSSDLQTLKQIIGELNAIPGIPEIKLHDQDANITIYFSPEPKFRKIEKNYRSKNMGFFWAWWDPLTYEIYRARILISSTGITQQERNHLIREELTQSLGLMNDSNRYPDSIFYQSWTRTTKYADIDKSVIRLLYRSDIQPGMTTTEIIERLHTKKDASTMY